MSTLPRHTTITDFQQCSEAFRDIIEALRGRQETRQVTVERWTATGSTDTRIPIGSGARPFAVTLVRCCAAAAEDAALVVTPVLNFVWDSTTSSLNVFEPDGLVANTVYRLQFLVTEVQS